MISNVNNFTNLNELLLKELQPPKFFKPEPVERIEFTDSPSFIKALAKRIATGKKDFNLIDQRGYITPLLENLEKAKNGDPGIISTLLPPQTPDLSPDGYWINIKDIKSYVYLTLLVNAALQPAQKEVAQYLRPAQAVVNDLYNTYLASRKRLGLEEPLDHKSPPCIGFIGAPLRFKGRAISPVAPMPTTLEVEQLHEPGILGSLGLAKVFTIGAVGLPAGYMDVPLLWGVLGHEVGGHYVLTSNGHDTLLAELKTGIYQLLKPKYGTEVASIWVRWTEEAASDVCGVLNLGPSFGIGAIGWYTTVAPCGKWPNYRTNELDDLRRQYLDDHPCPVLDPHVIRGAVEGLKNLKQSRKEYYSDQFRKSANALTRIKEVMIKNGSTGEDKDGNNIPLQSREFPLEMMQEAAYEVGRHIATAPLRALRGPAQGASSKDHDLQDLTTWDDDDEGAALSVADWLSGSSSNVSTKWTKVQLLSGGILAVTRQPDLYKHINEVLLNTFCCR